MKKLTDISVHNRGPQNINIKSFYGLDNLSSKTIEILDSVFSHSSDDVNVGYLDPTNNQSITFTYKPLIKQGNENRLLIDSSWCAYSYFEAITKNIFDNHDKKIYEKLGNSFETAVKSFLNGRGIITHSGKYKIEGQEGECDTVIETPSRIIFIEMKKKVLSHKARSGDDVNIFTDLAESLLRSQSQLGRHEILLRKHGCMRFTNTQEVHNIELMGRKIERITLTMKDWKSLQDRMLLGKLIFLVVSTDLKTVDNNRQSELKNLNKYAKKLRNQHIQLVELGKDVNPNMYMHCHFYSLPQVLIMLDGVNGVEEFEENLFITKHMTTSQMDFYCEYDYMKKLKSHNK